MPEHVPVTAGPTNPPVGLALDAVLRAARTPLGPGFVAVRGLPGDASVGDAEWERRAQKEEPDALTTVRGAAEKWTATVTSLTGILGIVVLVKGPEDVTKTKGGIDLLPGGTDLPGILGILIVLLGIALLAAGIWLKRFHVVTRLSSLGVGVLCVAYGLLWLGDDDWNYTLPWETLAILLLGLAVAYGVVATLRGARAAYGMPSRHSRPTGRVLRERRRSEYEQTRTALRDSIRAAVIAVGSLSAAIAVVWFSTPTKPPAGDLLVITNGKALCGALTGQDGSEIQVQKQGETKSTTIALADLTSAAAVPSCPE